MIDFNSIKMISSTIGFVINISKAFYNIYKLVQCIKNNPRKAMKKVGLFFNDKYTVIAFKTLTISGFILTFYLYFLIAGLIWLKFELSMQGFLLGFITLFILTAITTKLYKPVFKQLLLVNKNQNAPFTVIR